MRPPSFTQPPSGSRGARRTFLLSSRRPGGSPSSSIEPRWRTPPPKIWSSRLRGPSRICGGRRSAAASSRQPFARNAAMIWERDFPEPASAERRRSSAWRLRSIFSILRLTPLHELEPPKSRKPQPARRASRLAICNCSRCLAIDASCLRNCAAERPPPPPEASSASNWRQTRELAAIASEDRDASASDAAINAASRPRLCGLTAIRCIPAA